MAHIVLDGCFDVNEYISAKVAGKDTANIMLACHELMPLLGLHKMCLTGMQLCTISQLFLIGGLQK